MAERENAQRFFGKYRGVVTDIMDPAQQGRIKAKVPDVYGDQESGWAMPCAPFAGDGVGLCALPAKDAWVWIEFEQGDPRWPIWSGGFWRLAPEVPDGAFMVPYKKVLIKTPGKNSVLIDDTPGVGGITLKTATGQQIVLAADGITLKTAAGHQIALAPDGIVLKTAAGHQIALAPDGIALKTATGAKIAIGAAGIEINNGQGGAIKLTGPKVDVNNGALEVI